LNEWAATAVKTGISEFNRFLRTFGGLPAWACACAAVPFTAYLISLSPPWPSSIVVATSAVVLVAVWFVYRLSRGATARRATVILFVGAIGAAQLSIAYLILHSRYTFEITATKQRSAKGFVCTPVAKLVYGDKCPDLGKPELEAANYTAATLWTVESINIVRVNLIVLWGLDFAVLSVFVGTFAARQRRVGEAGVPTQATLRHRPRKRDL